MNSRAWQGRLRVVLAVASVLLCARAFAEPASQPQSAAAASAPADGEDQLKIRALEERVNELKEKIFRSKARLVLLQEAVLHGTISGSRAVIVHKNSMGSSFRLEEVQYSLDGTPFYAKTAEDIDKRSEFEVFNGSIVPGSHQLSVYLVYRGNGFGVFSYFNGYKFKVKSSYTLQAEDGKQATVKIVAYEKGGMAADFKDRPAVRYELEVKKELRKDTPTPDTSQK